MYLTLFYQFLRKFDGLPVLAGNEAQQGLQRTIGGRLLVVLQVYAL